MNIPPKYEDVVAQLAVAREEALILKKGTQLIIQERDDLRQELERAKSRYDREVLGLNNEGDPIGGDPAGGYKNDNVRLQQRLTVAEQRAGELESAAREMLRIAGIANQGSNAYNRAIINLNAALNPGEEGEGK